MTLDLSIEELQVLRQALRTCLDFGDRWFVFSPDVADGGVKRYYGSGNEVVEGVMQDMAATLHDKFENLTDPLTVDDKMKMFLDMKHALQNKEKHVDPSQESFEL